MHTHRLTIDDRVVRKRFVSWADGEADREWAGLVALARHAPGLAPTPIAREMEGRAPVIVMSRLPGSPLGLERLTTPQIHALAEALARLFSVPVDPSTPERAVGPSVMRAEVREWAADDYDLRACRDPALVGTALALARDWLAVDFPEIDRVAHAVPARGDGNLANILWDGATCRFVDFEEFGRSDLAYEVADILEHASSRLRRLLDVDLLLTVLDLGAALQSRLTAYRSVLATFWLVMLLPGNRGFVGNPAGSTEDQARHVIALLEG